MYQARSDQLDLIHVDPARRPEVRRDTRGSAAEWHVKKGSVPDFLDGYDEAEGQMFWLARGVNGCRLTQQERRCRMPQTGACGLHAEHRVLGRGCDIRSCAPLASGHSRSERLLHLLHRAKTSRCFRPFSVPRMSRLPGCRPLYLSPRRHLPAP
jgi:hypothetical protein